MKKSIKKKQLPKNILVDRIEYQKLCENLADLYLLFDVDRCPKCGHLKLTNYECNRCMENEL